MDLRPQTPWEASLAIWTKCPVVPRLGCVPRSWAIATAKEAKMPTLVSLVPGQCTRNVVGNDEGNKVIETIFTGSREFITLMDSGEIISQNHEPWSVSGARLNTYRVCPPPPYRMSQLQETLQS
jgi:hypothetical protein